MLRFYDNSVLRPVGEINLEARYKDRKTKAKIIVVDKNNRVSLMERDLMDRLGFSISGINNLSSQSNDVQFLVDKYIKVFVNQLGQSTGKKICLELKENPVERDL